MDYPHAARSMSRFFRYEFQQCGPGLGAGQSVQIDFLIDSEATSAQSPQSDRRDVVATKCHFVVTLEIAAFRVVLQAFLENGGLVTTAQQRPRFRFRAYRLRAGLLDRAYVGHRPPEQVLVVVCHDSAV